MPSPRTKALLFHVHTPHTTGFASFYLRPRSTCSFSVHHGPSRKRPQHPRGRHALAPQPTTVAFSTSTRASREQNYYEVLDLPVTSTAAEIKEQFYALSLRHHPDRNRTDPDASQRFARISSAYNVLGDAQRRATYDREHGFHHAHAHPSQRAPGQHPMGSHSSYSANLHNKGSYAGSRPPSGLSKRRGPFRGPPPSFYAQGGYGHTGRTAEGSHTAGAEDANQAASGGGFASSSSAGPAGRRGGHYYDPEDPAGFIDRNPLGHFDARGHFRTQSAEDARRKERRVKARRSAIKEEDIPRREGIGVIHFVVVCGMLAFASLTAAWFAPPATASPSVPVASASSGARSSDGKTGRRRKEESVSVSASAP